MNRYEQMKQIVANKQAEEIDGYLVDMASANLYCQVYEGVSEENKKKLDSLNTASAVLLCWKITG